MQESPYNPWYLEILEISDKINAKQLPAHCKVVHYHTDSHRTDAPP